MHEGQLEIKKLSLQLFHNSLDFQAGEQPRSLPFTESKKPTRYFSISLPFNFPPYTVQSPDRGPVHPTDSVEIYMYVYIYIREWGEITPSMISAGCLHRDTIPFYGFPWKIRDEGPPSKKKKATLL